MENDEKAPAINSDTMDFPLFCCLTKVTVDRENRSVTMQMIRSESGGPPFYEFSILARRTNSLTR